MAASAWNIACVYGKRFGCGTVHFARDRRMSAKNEVKRGLEEEEADMMETGREVERRR